MEGEGSRFLLKLPLEREASRARGSGHHMSLFDKNKLKALTRGKSAGG